MKIRYIFKESLLLPFREYKIFLIVFILALFCELISDYLYSLHIGYWSLLLMLFNSLITLMIVGVMINLTNNVVMHGEVNYFDFVEHLVEGIKEYIITFYYMILTFIFSSFFIVPTGVYANLRNIQEYIIERDINTTFFTIHELSKDIPVSLRLDLYHSIQVNILIGIMIFVVFFSFAFMGKIILNHNDNLLRSLDPRVIHGIIRNIGYFRYLRFVLVMSLVLVLLSNLLYYLGFYFSDLLISALLESLILFIATNAFYRIMLETR